MILPALWEVWREGHNLVSQDERVVAMNCLIDWANHSTFITGRKKNIFITNPNSHMTKPRLSVIDNKTYLMTQVGTIHPVFCSFTIYVNPKDMEDLDIRQSKFF